MKDIAVVVSAQKIMKISMKLSILQVLKGNDKKPRWQESTSIHEKQKAKQISNN